MGKLFGRQKHLFSEDEYENDDEIDDDNDEIDDDDDEIDDDDDEMDDDDEIDDDDDEMDDDDEIDDDDDEIDVDDEVDEDEEMDEDGELEEELEDDEDTESSGEILSREESRRAYRRKRRIRNQIIAYGVVLIFVAILVTAGVAAGRRISVYVKEKQREEKLAEQLEEQQDHEQQTEDMIVETPPEIEENVESTLDEQLEEFIDGCIAVMPLEDKVAGLFVITPESLTGVGTAVRAGEGTQNALNQYAVGGLIYFAQNILSKEQLTEMLSNTVSMSKYPIFLAVDEEGGEVSRVANSKIEVDKVDDMAAIGAGGDTKAAYEAGVTIGSYLNEIGFNLDFAPVADVISDTEGNALGNRSFGTDAELDAGMVSKMVEGMQSSGVSACLKHFPGIGSAREDTHDGRVETTRTLEEMRNSDFIPFQAGIEIGADLIMVGHITASGIDEEGLPSSLSKTVITDVLRGELGYDGIVITDALNMGAIAEYYTSDEAAVKAIKAGADMLLMPEDFETAYQGLLAAVQDGTISEERIEESLRRIYRIKYADKLE